MAQNKTKSFWPAWSHALVYSLPFILLTYSGRHIFNGALAFAVIFLSHFFIDRYRLVRYVVWAKNFIGPKTFSVYPRSGGNSSLIYNPNRIEGIPGTKYVRNLPWNLCTKTGYAETSPEWLAVWLMIIGDNTIHLAINYAALRWL